MKKLVFGMTLAGSLILSASAFADNEREREDDPCKAPLPALGLTLLGQLGAGALGWSLYRSQRA
jgi:hypothetical protein